MQASETARATAMGSRSGSRKPRIVSAVVRRELASYFSSPTGYVFITIFIFLSAFAAFWLPGFFGRNLATLDQLNAWFPALLLLLVPAITMGAWAEERRQGTEELLLTLPARDWELVLGKYLACLLIYTVALVMSLSNVVVLSLLGSPDIGLMLATYLGYWLCGVGLIAVGLVGSALTTNLTVSFIVSALLCAGLVGLGSVGQIMPQEGLGRVLQELSVPARFEDFGRGVVSLQNVAYFVLLALVGLWGNTLLVSRRHWSGAPGAGGKAVLALVRGAALVVACASLLTLASRTSARADATAERLWSLSPQTTGFVREISPERPVLITAYVSPVVPESYIQTRETLLGLLRELDVAEGGGRIALRVVETEPFSEAAREAKRNFNIEPRTVPPGPEDSQRAPGEVFLGVAFTCGAEQVVIPFLSRGLPVEYELVRSLRRVTAASRKKVGIVATDMGVLGSFDMQTFTSRPDWPITEELRKQYEVVQVGRGTEPPADIDCLIVPQPSLLTDAELASVVAYVKSGRPALIVEDPLPMVDPGLATSEDRNANMNPFMRQRAPNQEPKADLTPLWQALGAEVPADRVIWDANNPRPQFAFEREIVFVTGGEKSAGFSAGSALTAGLQELVFLMPGEVKALTMAGAPTMTPLVKTSGISGYVKYAEMLQKGFFGVSGFNRSRRQVPTTGGHVLAALVTGGGAAAAPAGEGEQPAAGPVKAIVLADVDLLSPEFFRLRESGVEEFNFDNVTFILNCVDTLVGDESLVELRKRRPQYRTLTLLDRARRTLAVEKDTAVDAANQEATAELAAAQSSLDRKVQEIQQRTDLDETTRGIMIESVRQAEQRRVDVQKAAIEDKKEGRITEAQTKANEAIDRVQMQIRLAAVLLPPVPALLLAGGVFTRRRAQELEGAARDRVRRG